MQCNDPHLCFQSDLKLQINHKAEVLNFAFGFTKCLTNALANSC